MFDRQLYKRLVIGVDPALTCHSESDETGIIVTGLGMNDHGYVVEDFSGRYSPEGWALQVVGAYQHYQANHVIVEINAGGDMVTHTLRTIDPYIQIKDVRAISSKHLRAFPVSVLYKQRRIYHEKPFEKLEAQLCSYIPGVTKKSPDRMDALVWALTDLMLGLKDPVPHIWHA